MMMMMIIAVVVIKILSNQPFNHLFQPMTDHIMKTTIYIYTSMSIMYLNNNNSKNNNSSSNKNNNNKLINESFVSIND